jgi:hypothetical protein
MMFLFDLSLIGAAVAVVMYREWPPRAPGSRSGSGSCFLSVATAAPHFGFPRAVRPGNIAAAVFEYSSDMFLRFEIGLRVGAACGKHRRDRHDQN